MKKKTLLQSAFMVTGIVLSGYFGPWWAPATFIVLMAAVSGMETRSSVVAGAALMSLVYLGMAMAQQMQDKTDLLQKTGLLLGGLSPQMLILLTTVVGTITGALAGWLGSETGKLVRAQTRKSRQ